MQFISPFAAVLLIAPANVLQGAVREHGLTSSPTPEIHVRVAWAAAGLAWNASPAIPTPKIFIHTLFMFSSPPRNIA
jgi:hypothetical protein